MPNVNVGPLVLDQSLYAKHAAVQLLLDLKNYIDIKAKCNRAQKFMLFWNVHPIIYQGQ